MEERLERLTQTVIHLDLESSSVGHSKEENSEEKSDSLAREHGARDGTPATSQTNTSDSIPGKTTEDKSHLEDQTLAADFCCSKKGTIDNDVPIDTETEKLPSKKEPVVAQISEACDTIVDDTVTNKQPAPRPLPNVVLPFLRYRRYEGSESSSSRYIFVLDDVEHTWILLFFDLILFWEFVFSSYLNLDSYGFEIFRIILGNYFIGVILVL